MTHVDWHPYPETKPDFYKPVLVTLSWPDGGRMVEIDLLHFYPSLKIEKWGYERSDRKIIAWAELRNRTVLKSHLTIIQMLLQLESTWQAIPKP